MSRTTSKNTDLNRDVDGARFITVTEVGIRDGLQAEAEFVETQMKIDLIDDMVDAGVRHIEFSSFVSPRAVPQLADAAQVIEGVRRVDGLCMTALVPNEKGAERAIDAGVDRIHVFLSASEQHNKKTSISRSVSRLMVLSAWLHWGGPLTYRSAAPLPPRLAARSKEKYQLNRLYLLPSGLNKWA